LNPASSLISGRLEPGRGDDGGTGEAVSPCFLPIQIKGNRYVRVFPKQANTFDCDPKSVFTTKLDQA
jgi:hypothetical protein